MLKDYLLIDIETIVAPDAELFMPEFKEPRTTKNGDLDKRDKTIEEQKQAWLDGCALRPLTGQVAVIGMNKNGLISQLNLNQGGEAENEIINNFNITLGHCIYQGFCIIGFNIKGFDLPFLSVRGSQYGIKPAWHFQDRYNTQILDIAEWYKQGVYEWKYIKCNDVFKFYGLDGKLADGSEFGKLWATDKQKALDYNRDELIKLEKVAKIIYE